MPFDLILAKELRLPPSAVRAMSNRDYSELLALFRLDAERAARRHR